MKKFELPQINIERFSVENIVTISTASTAAQAVAANLASNNEGIQSVNIVNWNSLTAE